MRLRRFAKPEEAQKVVVPAAPARLKPISAEEITRRNQNLSDPNNIPQNVKIAEEILNICLPEKNNIKLHDYQIRIVKHLLKHRGIIAQHSVGSGKTLIAATSSICLLRSNNMNISRVIFIGPKSLLSNFELTVNKAFDNVDWTRITLYTYEKFQLDYNKGLIDCTNCFLIIDEAHRLRTHGNSKTNKPAKTVKAVFKCARKASKVLLLTATPVVNDPYDIANLIAIIRGDLEAMDKKTFNKTIFSKKGQIMNQTMFDNYFHCAISMYVRPNDDTYPSVEIHTVKIPMSQKYYQEYMRVEDQLITELQEDVLGENDLKPFYNGVRRTVNADIEEFNSKLDWIRQHLLRFNRQKMVIFSPFISLGVSQLEKLVVDFDVKPKFGRIIGDDTAADRQKTIDDFNVDKIQVLLISVGAGGLGLNLIGTRHIILMQPGWNQVEMDQAIGRGVRFHSHTHLPPNERKVDVWKLLLVKPPNPNLQAKLTAKQSIDEIIEKIIERKDKIIQPFLFHLQQQTIEQKPC